LRDLLNENAITLIFWSEFGCPEPRIDPQPGESKLFHLRDTTLAGQIHTYRPSTYGTNFQIGRAPFCHIRLGYDRATDDFVRDSLGDTQFRHFSNIHATVQLLNQIWYIFAGGEYPDRGGEWGTPGNGLYVNGKLLPGGGDPFPLFYRGDKYSRVQLGDAGKVIFMNGVFGEQSTTIPTEWWWGSGWPDMDEIRRARRKTEVAQGKLDDTARGKALVKGIKPASTPTGPWSLASQWGPEIWGWFKALPWPLQLIYAAGVGVVVVLLAELWINGGRR
jgi:hypothetical protein